MQEGPEGASLGGAARRDDPLVAVAASEEERRRAAVQEAHVRQELRHVTLDRVKGLGAVRTLERVGRVRRVKHTRRLRSRYGVGVPEVSVLVEVRVQKSGLDHVGDGRASIDFHAELVASCVLEEPARLEDGLAYDGVAEDASKDRQDANRPNGCRVTCLLLQRENSSVS